GRRQQWWQHSHYQPPRQLVLYFFRACRSCTPCSPGFHCFRPHVGCCCMQGIQTVGRASVHRSSLFAAFFVLFNLGVSSCLAAEEVPTSMGLTGLINMPSGRMATDGMLYMGYSYSDPYGAAYGVMQALPWLQISGRYTRIKGV